MRSFTTVVALASIVPAVMSLSINTPSSVVQCQPQLLGWTDGTAPYYLSVIPGGQPSAAALQTFDTQNGNSLTWKVNQAAGTKLTFSVKDTTGAVAYSDIVTVQQGPDSSCLGSSGGQPQPAAPPAAQDVPVNSSSATTSGVSTAVSSSAVVIQTGTIRPASSVSGVTASRVASVAVAPSSTTQSVSRTSATARAAASSSSGAESSLNGHGYGFVGALGLIGALFL